LRSTCQKGGNEENPILPHIIVQNALELVDISVKGGTKKHFLTGLILLGLGLVLDPLNASTNFLLVAKITAGQGGNGISVRNGA